MHVAVCTGMRAEFAGRAPRSPRTVLGLRPNLRGHPPSGIIFVAAVCKRRPILNRNALGEPMTLSSQPRAAVFGALALAVFAAPAFASDILDPSTFASSGALNLVSGNYTIDTSSGPGGVPVLKDSMGDVLATGSLYDQGGYLWSGGTFDRYIGVLDFGVVNIGSGATLTVTGANPLALLSRSTETVDGDVLANGAPGQTHVTGIEGAGGAGGPGGAPEAMAAAGLSATGPAAKVLAAARRRAAVRRSARKANPGATAAAAKPPTFRVGPPPTAISLSISWR